MRKQSSRASRRGPLRVVVSALVVCLAAGAGLFAATRKSVALTVNGETTQVSTYALTVSALLSQQGVTVATHDVVTSTHDGALQDGDEVSYCTAFEASVSIDGTSLPFWTCASSADELLAFFDANERRAMEVHVDITSAYNQITGGFVINSDGPVTVIADGRSKTFPDGAHTAASLLDASGVILQPDDLVSVEDDGNGGTILRVRRVTYGTQTRQVVTPRGTTYVNDDTLPPGETLVAAEGQDGIVEQTLRVTYADGEPIAEEVTGESVIQEPINQIVGVGPERSATPTAAATAAAPTATAQPTAATAVPTAAGTPTAQPTAATPSAAPTAQPTATPVATPTAVATATAQPTASPTATPTENTSPTPVATVTATPTPAATATTTAAPSPSPTATAYPYGDESVTPTTTVWHATPEEAKTYAKAALKAYGWDSDEEWDALEAMWTKESNWRWDADNPYSHAYGIPQALPASKMGEGWKDNAAVQITWGLYYIRTRYGSPSKAWEIWQKQNWY